MTPLSVVSVCAGIGGFDLGFERAGMETRAVVEIDADCREVLARRFPRAAQFEDLATVRGAELPACDVLAGGTPCQGFSFAGLREGLADDRSNLALHFCRLADELDPALTIWENVPGVLSMSDNAFGCILGALVGADSPLRPPHQHGPTWTSAGLVIGPRRAAAWRVLDAQYFGVAQRRRRVFVVASATPELCVKILFERAGLRGDSSPGSETRQEAAVALGAGPGRGGDDGRGDRSVIPHVAGTLGGSSQKGGFRTTDLDNNGALVIGALNTSTGYTADNAAAGHYVAGTLCQNGKAAGSATQQDAESGLLVFQPRVGRNGRGAPESICPALTGADAGATSDMRPCVAFPANLSGTQAAAASDISPALQAANPTAVASQIVRRLTPVECERLQGFPDGWTDGQADTPRYKQLGNAVNVNVAEWIGRRIVRAVAAPTTRRP